MHSQHLTLSIQNSNEYPLGKHYRILLLLLLLLFAGPIHGEKKHRRELPIPKREKEKNLPPLPANTNTRARASHKGKGSADAFSQLKASEGSEIPDHTCTDKYPIERFMQILSAHSPEPSRQGGVYFISDLREAPQLFTLETPGAWPEQITFFPDGLRSYQVSPDGQKILLSTDEGGNEQYDIHLLNIKTKKLTPLIIGNEKRVESVRWDSRSSWFAFTSTARNQKDLDLYRYDLAQNKSILLTTLEGYHTVSDISSNDNLIALERYRSVTDSEILIYDQKGRQLLNPTAELKSFNSSAKFTKDGDAFFFISDYGSQVPHLNFLRITNNSIIKPVTSGRWGVDSFKLNEERTALIFTLNEDGYSRFEGFEIDSRGKKKERVAVPDLSKSVLSGYSPAKTYGKGSLFFTASHSKRTSDVWLWKRGSAIQWTQSTQGLINPNCYQAEWLITYPTFDKKEIPAFIYLPAGVSLESPTPVPFVVFIHGGPESQYRPAFNKTFQYLLQRGFGIFAPNIRGSTGYGKDYTLLDNYKKRMDSIQDVIEGSKWLIKKQLTQSKLLSIYGASYGGFVVLRAIEVEPSLFAAASEGVGITNFVTFLKNTKPYRRELRELEYGPLSDVDFLNSISPINFVGSIKIPLQIFHGANDPRVPLSETEQLIEALKKKGLSAELKIFNNEGHGNSKLQNIIAQAKQMAFFFEKHIKR